MIIRIIVTTFVVYFFFPGLQGYEIYQVDESDGEEFTFLTDEDFEGGRLLDHLINPDLFIPKESIFRAIDDPNIIEGDIVVTPVKEAAITQQYNFWPNNRIPYTISSAFTPSERQIIARGIEEYHKNTCLKFVGRTNSDRNYVSIVKGRPGVCSSPVGRQPNAVNTVNLGQGCVNVRTVVHEIMHSVGFKHEMSRFDRDNYITLVSQNIPPAMKHNFDIAEKGRYKDLLKYDYRSVMHYDETAFGNGRVTIRTKDPQYQKIIGNGPGFSKSDIQKINLLYKCSGSGGSGNETTTDPTGTGTGTDTRTTSSPGIRTSGTMRPPPRTSRPTLIIQGIADRFAHRIRDVRDKLG